MPKSFAIIANNSATGTGQKIHEKGNLRVISEKTKLIEEVMLCSTGLLSSEEEACCVGWRSLLERETSEYVEALRVALCTSAFTMSMAMKMLVCVLMDISLVCGHLCQYQISICKYTFRRNAYRDKNVRDRLFQDYVAKVIVIALGDKDLLIFSSLTVFL